MNGTILFAQQLKEMKLPWSQTAWLGFPDETSFWFFTRFSQFVHWITIYILTRFLSATETINFILLLGWTLTGLLACLVAREIGVSKYISIGVGLSTQSLPWIREKIEEHLSYVYICVPMLVILCLLKFIINRSSKNGVALIGSIALTFVFDLYWFYFCLYLILLSFGVLYAKKVKLLKKSFLIIVLSTALAATIVAFQIVNKLLKLASKPTATISSRSLGVPDWKFVNEYSGSPADYINRDPLHPYFSTLFDPTHGSDNVYYVGISIVVLAIIGIASLIKAKGMASSRVLLTSFLFTFALSLRKVDLGVLSIPAINQGVKYVMPGARVFLRSGLIAQSLLVVVAGVGLQYLSSVVTAPARKALFVSFIALIVLFDLQPFAGRTIYRDGEDFRQIANVLSEAEDPPFLNTNPELFRTPEFLNQPTFNTLSNLWKVRLYPHAAKGSSDVAKYLDGLGIGFVVAPVNTDGFAQISGWIQDSTFFTTVLSESDFVPIGDDFTTRDSGDISLRLLQVNSRSLYPDHSCANCSLALGDISPQLLYDGSEPGYQQQITLWSTEPKLSIYPREIDSVPVEKFRIRITFVSAGGATATPQTVGFQVGNKNGEFDLSAVSGETKDFWVPKGETLLLEAIRPCFVPSEQIEGNSDSRRLCWGISSMLIEAVR
jgi:hypothetical protein